MASVGIRELRNDIANVVRRAASGERLVVTVDGRPVARLVPLEPGAERVTIDDLIAVGAVRPPARGRPEPPEVVDVPVDARSDRAVAATRGG